MTEPRRPRFAVENGNEICQYTVRAHTKLLLSKPPPPRVINDPHMIAFLVRYINDDTFKKEVERKCKVKT